MIQLNPMLRVIIPSFANTEGYAFAMINESQEHNLQFVIAMDNGEIWVLESIKIRFCNNISLGRDKINLTDKSEYV